MEPHDTVFVYVGAYSRGRNEGVYVYRMDASSGELFLTSTVGGLGNPAFLAIDPQQRYLYTVDEGEEVPDPPIGTATAFSIDRRTGELGYLNRQPTQGAGPCYVTVNSSSSFVLVSHYYTGNVCVLPIHDGRLAEAVDVAKHEGSSVNPDRQQGPHAHSINLDPASRYAFAADLGIDKLVVYELDSGSGKLRLHDEFQAKPGAGPRHFSFHPAGKYAYLINELDSTLTAYSYDGNSGTLTALSTVSTLPDAFDGENTCADVHASPSGRFVYGSNRGHDSIAIFEVDQDSGRLTLVDHEPTQGKTPRNFAIDPTGTFLLAANQDTGTIVTFRMNDQTGKLTPTGHVAEVPEPACMKVVRFA